MEARSISARSSNSPGWEGSKPSRIVTRSRGLPTPTTISKRGKYGVVRFAFRTGPRRVPHRRVESLQLPIQCLAGGERNSIQADGNANYSCDANGDSDAQSRTQPSDGFAATTVSVQR